MTDWMKILLFVVAVIGVAIGYQLLGNEAHSSSDRYSQPIAFSHKVHAGENKIPCQYCHHSAAKAASPSIPSVKECIGCHKFIAGQDKDYDYNGKTINFKEEISKLSGYWSRQEPIAWNNYHFVPEHARFKHQPHIRAGVECATCHGDVENVDLVVPVLRIEMGWCMSCHREKQKSESEMAELAAQGKELAYLRDCAACHY